MSDIEAIRRKIQEQYERSNRAARDIPLPLQAIELCIRAKDYIIAASVLDRSGPEHWLPMLQLTGHAVELSLKACLASVNVAPPSSHDLIGLYQEAKRRGFQLDERNLAAIVHLQHFYFEDLATGTKYKTRYPANRDERLGGAVPNNSIFTSIVDALLIQAKEREN